MSDSTIKGVLDRGETSQLGAALAKLNFGTRFRAIMVVLSFIGSIATKVHGWIVDLWDGLQKVCEDLGSVNTNLNTNLGKVRTDLGNINTRITANLGKVRTDLDDINDNLNTNLGKVRTDVGTIQTTTNNNVNKLKTAIDTLITRINTLMRPVAVTGIAVAAHTVTLTGPGIVLHVYGSVGDTPGEKQLVSNAAAKGAGLVFVAYDAAGVATLEFAVADAITECAVIWLPTGADVSVEALAVADQLTTLDAAEVLTALEADIELTALDAAEEIQELTDPEIDDDLEEPDTDAADDMIVELDRDFAE